MSVCWWHRCSQLVLVRGARLLVRFTDSALVMAQIRQAPSAALAVDAGCLTECHFLLLPLSFALFTDSHLSQGLGDPLLWGCCPAITCLLVTPAPCWGCCPHRQWLGEGPAVTTGQGLSVPAAQCPGPVPGTPAPWWLVISCFSFWSPTCTS